MTQQNAALVEASSNAANSMRAHAGELEAAVAAFKLGEDVSERREQQVAAGTDRPQPPVGRRPKALRQASRARDVVPA
jgi:hypothetical protein